MTGFLKIIVFRYGVVAAMIAPAALGGVGLPTLAEVPALHPPAFQNGEIVTEVSVEVVAKGESPEWVLVRIPAEAIPEPAAPLLLLPALALMLRRRRLRGA